MGRDRHSAQADLALLLQATAQLHPAGPPDQALIGALQAMTAMRAPPAQPTEWMPVQRKPPPVAVRAAAAEVLYAELPPPSATMSGMQVTDFPGREMTTAQAMQAQHVPKSISVASEITQIVEQAGLASPRNAGQIRTERTVAGIADAPLPSAPSEGLFPPNRARAMLRELSTLPTSGHIPDMGKAVSRIARALPLMGLPSKTVSVLGHEVHLLFDAGPGMLPFIRDKQQLASTVPRMLGSDRVRIADFLGAPTRGVRAQREVRWGALRWPSRRSALLVISDLGIGEHGQHTPMLDDWQAFIDEAQRRELRTAVLIPYPRERWPAVASRFDTALTWDLNAGVQSLRHAMRMGARP